MIDPLLQKLIFALTFSLSFSNSFYSPVSFFLSLLAFFLPVSLLAGRHSGRVWLRVASLLLNRMTLTFSFPSLLFTSSFNFSRLTLLPLFSQTSNEHIPEKATPHTLRRFYPVLLAPCGGSRNRRSKQKICLRGWIRRRFAALFLPVALRFLTVGGGLLLRLSPSHSTFLSRIRNMFHPRLFHVTLPPPPPPPPPPTPPPPPPPKTTCAYKRRGP